LNPGADGVDAQRGVPHVTLDRKDVPFAFDRTQFVANLVVQDRGMPYRWRRISWAG
jgi:hypothetical protein